MTIASILAASTLLAACDDDIEAAAPVAAPTEYTFVRMDGITEGTDPAMLAQFTRTRTACMQQHPDPFRALACMNENGYARHSKAESDAAAAYYRANPRPMPKG